MMNAELKDNQTTEQLKNSLHLVRAMGWRIHCSQYWAREATGNQHHDADQPTSQFQAMAAPHIWCLWC